MQLRWYRSNQKRFRKLTLRLAGAVLVLFLISCSTGSSLQAQEQLSKEELLKLFGQIYDRILDEYVDEVSAQNLIHAALEGMIDSLGDQFSRFLDEEEFSELLISTSGTFGGLGMHVNKHRSDDEAERYLEVISPIEGTPAFSAGMRSGDLIIGIEGESTQPMSVLEAVQLLRGEPGSSVTIQVRRGNGDPYDVTLTRAVITVPATRSGIIDDDIAYIRLLTFSESNDEDKSTAGSFKAFFETKYEDDFKGLIVDLRGNGGGLLSVAIKMTDHFFDDGNIVSIKGRSREQVFNATKKQLVPDSVPILVLIDKATASASEILAGALKDRGRATIIGSQSYGKGSVQEIIPFQNGDPLYRGGIRLTTARYYTPSGISIDTVGISPDIEVAEPEFSEEEDAAFARLVESGEISVFVQNNPGATQQEQDDFIADLAQRYAPMNEWYVRGFLRSELFRANENQLIPFDVEYDQVLKKAVEYLRSQ